jgi:hypothetical protein
MKPTPPTNCVTADFGGDRLQQAIAILGEHYDCGIIAVVSKENGKETLQAVSFGCGLFEARGIADQAQTEFVEDYLMQDDE